VLYNSKEEDQKIAKKSFVYLVSDLNPKCPDNILKMETDNRSQETFYEKCNPKFNKLEYAFGFKFRDLREGKLNSFEYPRLEHVSMYGYGERRKKSKEIFEKKINLDTKDFILVERKFKNSLLFKN
jgi:hypothetical protein